MLQAEVKKQRSLCPQEAYVLAILVGRRLERRGPVCVKTSVEE
jgi:hypothetical protein